jgi:hypothetical protein
MAQLETIKYKGLTKRKYKQLHGSSTPGSTKSGNCKATGLDKALCKYPRSFKTMTGLYISFNFKKDKDAKRTTGFFQSIK